MMLVRTLILFAAISTTMLPTLVAAQINDTPLTLERALEIAAVSRLELTAADAETEAAQHHARQEGAWNNPVFFLELEGAPTDGDAWQNADRVIGFGQTLSLGGRRGANRDAANLLALATEARRNQTAQVVAASVRRAFARVLFAEGLVVLHDEIVISSQTAVDIVSSRLELGGATSDELAHASLELSVAQLGQTRSLAELEMTHPDLAVALGMETGRVLQLDGILGKTGDLPNLDVMLAELDRSPGLQAVNARAEAAIASARSVSRSRIPDVDLSLGIRRFGGSSSMNDAVDAGVSFQLPLFNRNSAKIASARANVVAGQAVVRLTRIELERRIRDIHSRLETANDVVKTYTSDLLPAADTVLASIEQRHAADDAELIDVLQVRTTWVDRRLADLEARLELDLIRAELAAVSWR